MPAYFINRHQVCPYDAALEGGVNENTSGTILDRIAADKGEELA